MRFSHGCQMCIAVISALLVVNTGTVTSVWTLIGGSTISRAVPILCRTRGTVFIHRRIALTVARRRSLWCIVLVAALSLRRSVLARTVRSSTVSTRPITQLVGILSVTLARRWWPRWRIIAPILVRTLSIPLTRVWHSGGIVPTIRIVTLQARAVPTIAPASSIKLARGDHPIDIRIRCEIAAIEPT